jgi:hypothetical protein
MIYDSKQKVMLKCIWLGLTVVYKILHDTGIDVDKGE